jgi:hypothetical protein
VLVALTMAVGVVACGQAPVETAPTPAVIPIATQGPPPDGLIACRAALLSGTLVRDDRTGLAVAGVDVTGSGDDVVPVRWPSGWMALETVPVALVDADGRVVAHVGDHIAMGGGIDGPGDTWIACPTDIKVEP